MTPAQRIKKFMNAKDDAERKEIALAIYHVAPGWTHYILKQNHGKGKTLLEAVEANKYASCFCAVRSPMTFGSFDYSDTYISDFIGGDCEKETLPC